MLVADMMQPEGRVFLKSEWAPLSDRWPCVSFTKRSVGQKLGSSFVPGRDILIYVGTSNPDFTDDANHRSRLISAAVVEPNQILETRKIVPPTDWARAVEVHGDRWPHSLAVISAADLEGPPFPRAHDIIPQAYRSFAAIENRGNIVEALGEERTSVMALPVKALALNMSAEVTAYLGLRAVISRNATKDISAEAWRLADLIVARVKAGGSSSIRLHPVRSAPILSDLYAMLVRKWTTQGACGLCGGALIPGTKNAMLQASADRIDSMNNAYDEDNVQITHLACNLAKNQYGLTDFEDWLGALRGIDLST